MFRLFRRKKNTDPKPEAAGEAASGAGPGTGDASAADLAKAPAGELPQALPGSTPEQAPPAPDELPAPTSPQPEEDDPITLPPGIPAEEDDEDAGALAPDTLPLATEPDQPEEDGVLVEQIEVERRGWLGRLSSGLQKTGQSFTGVFAGSQIDDDLYEELEAALLMADAGVAATVFLMDDLRSRVRAQRAKTPEQARELLRAAITDLLQPLEKTLEVGRYHPTIIMMAGVNGAGKTTSIGKLTRHLSNAGATVLLAAADTFRAAAREQLEIWADRNQVEIISQHGGDPAAVSFDAVAAGRARGRDVVLVDTAGRLPTQKNLMQELAKIHRVISKADVTGPHEVLLVIDGNTGQNALAQVKAFGATIPLTGLIVTKLDGTAKGGVLCAIAREHPVPVYFIGIGEQLEDLQTFRAAEFAQALLG